jgi:hypothetical protein
MTDTVHTRQFFGTAVPGAKANGSVLRIFGSAIAANPAAFLDAMVADGILVRQAEAEEVERHDGPEFEVAYIVPEPPHEHEWFIDPSVPALRNILIVTCDCGVFKSAPNRLPIEVPE